MSEGGLRDALQHGALARQWRGARLIDRAAVNELRVDWEELGRREQLDRRKLREMIEYAYYEQCLRQYILKYFGDRKEVTGCRCSNCQPGLFVPKIEPGELKAKQAETTETPVSVGPRALSASEHLAVRKILSCVARLDGKFGKGTVAGVLRGSKAKNIREHQLDQLSTYGMLSEYSQDELTRFLNALIVAECVNQTGGAYPTVSLTPLGKEVMHDRARVELDLEGVEADTSEDAEILLDGKPRSETHEQSYELYKQGLTVAEIAAQRNLKPITIEQHLAELLEQGRDVRVEDFVTAADRVLIENAAREHGLDKLRPLKDAVPESIGYTQIRFVVAALRGQQNQPLAPDVAPRVAPE